MVERGEKEKETGVSELGLQTCLIGKRRFLDTKKDREKSL